MKAVRQIRLMKSKSIDDIFVETGISIPKISRIERGIYQPTEREKKLISKALRESPKKVFPVE